jgi:hypothetical protein
LIQICTTHDLTELKLINHLLFTFYSSIHMNSPFSSPSILLTRVHFVRKQRDLACAQMKFQKQMRDMRDLLRFKAYFQFNVTF